MDLSKIDFEKAWENMKRGEKKAVNKLPHKNKERIWLRGLGDSTLIEIELTVWEFELMQEISRISKENSEDSHMPIILEIEGDHWER